MNCQVTKNTAHIFPTKGSFFLGAKGNFPSFELTNSKTIMKYPKIPAAIVEHFEQYDATENVVKYIFFFLLEYYQAPGFDVFMGPKWIEFAPEDIAKKFNISIDWLMNKTSNHPHSPYQCWQLYQLGLGLDDTKWRKKNRDRYNSLIGDNKPIYDTIFTDALYRMAHQSIPIEDSFIEPSIKNQWDMHYRSEGFKILDTFEVVFRMGRPVKVKAKLSDKLIKQMRSFFMLIKPSSYKNVLVKSKGRKETGNIYIYLNNKRNLHFFGNPKKSETEPCRIPFYALCNKVGLNYKKDPDKEHNYRYENARKSLSRKLKQIDFISHFKIERVTASKPLIDVFLYFTKPDEGEMQVINEFENHREERSIKTWLADGYREQLKPGLNLWDDTTTEEHKILDKYFNEKYYNQWLANQTLHIEAKRTAVNAAFTELYGPKSFSQHLIDKKLQEASQAAKKRIKIEKWQLIEPCFNFYKKSLYELIFKKEYSTLMDMDYETQKAEKKSILKYIKNELDTRLDPKYKKAAYKNTFSQQQAYYWIKDNKVIFAGTSIMGHVGLSISNAPIKAIVDNKNSEEYKETYSKSSKDISKVKVQNSPWDGSVYQVKRYLKNTLNDPKSYESISWGEVKNTTQGYSVWHKYRAKNAFGSLVVKFQIFHLNFAGDVTKVDY